MAGNRRDLMSYTPRTGSVADYVIRRLNAPDAPERLSSVAIQRALGKSSAASVWVCCERAVDVGLLDRFTVEGRTFYALPEHAQPDRGVRVMAWVARQALEQRSAT